MTDTGVHIASFVVWAVPGRFASVLAGVRDLASAEVHFEPGIDKLVVVVEARSVAEILDLIADIGTWAGVANVQLVYQHSESAEALREEIVDETHPA